MIDCAMLDKERALASDGALLEAHGPEQNLRVQE